VLQRVVVCGSVLQCVAVCCSVLQCAIPTLVDEVSCLLQCVAVCCSVLQCVAACCSVLQCNLFACDMAHSLRVNAICDTTHLSRICIRIRMSHVKYERVRS